MIPRSIMKGQGKRSKEKVFSGNVARKTENVAAKPLIRFNDFAIQRFNNNPNPKSQIQIP